MTVPMPDIQLSLLLPEIVLAVAAMGMLLASAWWEGEGKKVALLETLALTAVGVTLAFDLMFFPLEQGGPESTFGGMFVVDAFSTYTKALMCIATMMAIAMGRRYVRSQNMAVGEYLVLMMFSLLGGLTMASAGSFLTLYLGLELMSLSIYVLAAFKRDDPKSNEAGLKYFMLGSVASGLLLYGISLIYGVTGLIDFQSLNALLSSADYHGSMAVNVGLILIVAGLGFKIAAAPFHMWAPDVYQGAPTSVTAFMAAMPKVAAFAAIYRILIGGLFPLHPYWVDALQAIAIISLAVGAFAAIAQSNIKRMLAYSSIGHVGYALIGLVAGEAAGYQSVMVYITIYVFMNLGAFGLILALNQAGVGEEIDDYKGLSQKRPRMAFLMALFMFSMAGIPPLAGFIGKFYIFVAAIQSELYILATLGVLFSAVGAFYYLRIVKLMYFDKAETEFDFTFGISNQIVVGICAIVIGLGGLFPNAILGWAQTSVKVFL